MPPLFSAARSSRTGEARGSLSPARCRCPPAICSILPELRGSQLESNRTKPPLPPPPQLGLAGGRRGSEVRGGRDSGAGQRPRSEQKGGLGEGREERCGRRGECGGRTEGTRRRGALRGEPVGAVAHTCGAARARAVGGRPARGIQRTVARSGTAPELTGAARSTKGAALASSERSGVRGPNCCQGGQRDHREAAMPSLGVHRRGRGCHRGAAGMGYGERFFQCRRWFFHLRGLRIWGFRRCVPGAGESGSFPRVEFSVLSETGICFTELRPGDPGVWRDPGKRGRGFRQAHGDTGMSWEMARASRARAAAVVLWCRTSFPDFRFPPAPEADPEPGTSLPRQLVASPHRWQ